VISFSCRAMTNLVAFWLTDVRGLVNLYMVVSTTLSGLLVPLPFLPGWAITLAYLTPFPWMLQVPSDIAVERRAGLAALGAVGVGACWAVALLAAASWMLSRGTRKLVVQGG
jgi:ABC-2 type transport system permease protein